MAAYNKTLFALTMLVPTTSPGNAIPTGFLQLDAFTVPVSLVFPINTLSSFTSIQVTLPMRVETIFDPMDLRFDGWFSPDCSPQS